MAAKRIVLTTIGTRGDVQPFAALALGLKSAGYNVRLAAPENFKQWIEGMGLEYARCGNDARAFVTSPETIEFLEGNIWYQIRNARKIGFEFIQSITEDIHKATQDADGIIYHPKADFSLDVAEAKNIPAIMAGFQPLSPTREFPILILPWKTLGPTLNRMSYGLIYLGRTLYNKYLNQRRADFLGLAPKPLFSDPMKIGDRPLPVLYALSEHIVPRPRDWPPHIQLTGYWFLNETPDWQPPDDLLGFLKGDRPTIYIGFGSMPLKHPDASGAMLLQALRAAGVRAVMARGWAGLRADNQGDMADQIYILEQAPHEHLFPMMTAVVHHGGAGTTAAGLRAGKPTFICPFLVDQPFWGKRIEELGAGPEPLPPKKWTSAKLEQSFRTLVERQDFRRNAQHLGEKINAENGVARAVDLVREIVGGP